MQARFRRVDPALLALVAEGFLSRLSFGFISFALPLYAYHLGLSLSEIGLLASLNPLVALLLKPAMGSLADRLGCKPMLVVAISFRSLVSLLLAFATVPWQLYATRSAHGLSTSLRDPSVNALLAEHAGQRAVASAFAWYQTAKSFAGSLGAALAGLLLGLTASRFSVVFFTAFVLSTLPIFAVVRFVSERRDGERDQAAPSAVSPQPLRAVPCADRPPPTLPFMGLGLLISSTAQMVTALLPVLATQYAGLTTSQAGSIYFISTASILTGPLFGWISDHVSRNLVMRIRSVANAVSSLVYLAAPNFPGFAVGVGLDGMGKAAFRPAWGALMAYVAGFDMRRRARTMGLISMGEDAGEAVGPILGGFLWNAYGVAILLSTRAALAVCTEIYTHAVTHSLKGHEPHRPDRLRLRSAFGLTGAGPQAASLALSGAASRERRPPSRRRAEQVTAIRPLPAITLLLALMLAFAVYRRLDLRIPVWRLTRNRRKRGSLH